MAIGSPQWMYASGEEYTLDQSLRTDRASSTTLSKTFASAGNRKTWTFSVWFKRGNIGGTNNSANKHTFFNGYDQDNFVRIADDCLQIYAYNSSTGVDYGWISTAVVRDTSAWYHALFVMDTTSGTASQRQRIYLNGVELTDKGTDYGNPPQDYEGYVNTASLHYVAGSHSSTGFDGYIAEVNFVDGQALTPSDFGETGDYGEWKPKEYSGTYGTNGFYLPFKQDYSVEGFSATTYKGNGSTNYIGGSGFSPSLVWIKERGTSQQHNLFDKVRGTNRTLHSQSTEAEEFLKGTQLTAFNTDGYLLNSDEGVNESGATYVSWQWDMGADTPTGFGAVDYKGNGGTQSVSGFGFRPDVTWTKARHTTYDHYFEDRIRGAGKILYWNKTVAEETITHAITSFDPDGFSLGSEGGHNENNGTFISYGWDMGGTSVTNTTGSINATVMANPTYGQSLISYDGNSTNGATVGHGLSSAPEVVLVMNRERAHNPSMWHTSIPNTHYLHLDGTAASAANTAYWNSTSPTSSVFSLGTSNDINANGENHMALCFHSVSGYSKFGSYTGNGSSTGPTVTLGFRPSMIILKPTSSADHWNMYDSTRDPLNPTDSLLFPNRTNAEATGQEIEITDTGFQLKTDNSGSNGNGETYIYMAFAGGKDSSSTYNTDGSIDSRVKANTTYGQSIVSYTGNGAGSATVGHGLSSAPEMMIVRSRGSNAWAVYHTSMGNTHLMELNTTAAKADNNTFWNDTSPTSSVFTIGSHGEVNANNTGFIAYCWHSVTGYSKFSSYSGTGSSGNSVTTGFAPAFVLIKCTNEVEGWKIFDNTRNPTNPATLVLSTNSSNAESNAQSANRHIQFDSNGFTVLGTDASVNGSSDTYIYMAFADKREYAYWLDQSGNNNDWTSNNLTESDISVDSPTNNFATLNPLDWYGASNRDRLRFKEGNLWTYVTDTAHNRTPATIGVSSGKFYWEVLMWSSTSYFWQDQEASVVALTGFNNAPNNGDANEPGRFENNGATYHSSGTLYHNDGSTASWGSSYTKGDIISIALDMDNGKVWFAKNGVWQASGNPATGANPAHSGMLTHADTYTAMAYLSYGDSTEVFNFGQDSSFAGIKTAQGNQDSNDIGDFYYTPPSGFLALCTDNLPDVAVVPSEHFNTLLYTGNATANRSITGVGFAPDFIWAKERNLTAHHVLVDAVRGTSSGGRLSSNRDNAEDNTGGVTIDSFDSDGFTTGSSYSNLNGSTPFVAWNWKANGSGSSNSNGSITSTVSANTDGGFSIIKYHGNATAGATIGHGLSKAPELVICKDREAANGWGVGAFNENNTKALYLSSTGTFDTNNYWNSTNPSATLITLGISGATNANNEMICYAWHSVDGYSKVGSYTGNGSTDGTFVHTSFAPAYILWKNVTDSGTNWVVFDNKRDTYNPNDDALYPNTSGTEEEDYDVDFLSNGFKFRNTSSWANSNGKSYIYMAFAETPFKYSNGR